MPFTHLLKDTENKQTHKITLQPTFHVPAEHITCLQDDESFAWRDRCFLAPQPNPHRPLLVMPKGIFKTFPVKVTLLPF